MRIKIHISVLSLFLVFCIILGLASCNGNKEPGGIDKNDTNQADDKNNPESINNAFYNQYGTKLIYEKYYGVYEDAQIFFVAEDATAIRYVSIAGSIFKYNTLWEIYVFKNLKFYKLQEAYLLGVLSNQSVYELSKVHADYVKSQRKESDDDFNAWYYNTEDIQEIIN